MHFLNPKIFYSLPPSKLGSRPRAR